MKGKRMIILACALMLAMPALADDAPKAAASKAAVFDADDAYQAMLKLEGSWKGEANVVPAGKTKEEGTVSESSVTYKVIANGSSIMATYLEGSPMEMVSMYHQDQKDQLVHTHYCAVGNQPTMRFEKSEEPGVINFEFDSGTNMDVNKDGHVHAGYLKIVDENTIESETEIWRNGKVDSIRYTKLTRQK